MGIPNPCGGHGHRRRAARHAVQASPGAERGGRVRVRGALGLAGAPAAAPRRGRREGRHPLAAVLYRRQLTCL